MSKPPGEDNGRQRHIDALKDADETLRQAQESLAQGRARLQRVIARYEERSRDPRRGAT